MKSKSEVWYQKACQVMPGGVNSPVRAFGAVGGTPICMRSAKGAYLYDEDQHTYIDLINSWGPMILGHAHPEIVDALQRHIAQVLSLGTLTSYEVEVAALICEAFPSIEQIRMVNSGTEATLSALRLARSYTQREKIVKFSGCYHGHADAFLIEAGSGAATTQQPTSTGIPQSILQDTLTAPYNDLSAVELLFRTYGKEIAAIIIEPVAGNMGCVPPQTLFLQKLRDLCHTYGALLIFDEVMTGFRLDFGGAQTLYQVLPDLTTLGKIIGGGMPIGAYGGRREIMQQVSPIGPMYQAGTLAGHPLSMICAKTTLNYLKHHPNIYQTLQKNTSKLTQSMRHILLEKGVPHVIQQVGSMFTLFFTELSEISNFEDARKSNTQSFAKYFHAMLAEGVYLPPSQFECCFLSIACDTPILEKVLKAHKRAVDICF